MNCEQNHQALTGIDRKRRTVKKFFWPEKGFFLGFCFVGGGGVEGLWMMMMKTPMHMKLAEIFLCHTRRTTPFTGKHSFHKRDTVL